MSARTTDIGELRFAASIARMEGKKALAKELNERANALTRERMRASIVADVKRIVAEARAA